MAGLKAVPYTRSMQDCDLIVTAPFMLPVAPENAVCHDHALAIGGENIVAFGPRDEITGAYNASDVLDLSQHIVLPGLVNAHGHLAMTLLRGAGEDQALQAWLTDTIWPLEGRLVNEQFVELGTRLAFAEMLKSGTTTFSDMYFFPENVARVATEIGMRGQLAFPVFEMSNVWSSGVAECLHKGLALNDEYRHHPLVTVSLGPHAAYTVGLENLDKVAMYANELDIGVQIHLHENSAEVTEARGNHGRSWVEHLYATDFLGPNVQAVHMTQLTESEIGMVADTGTRVIHCPASNLKLASGYCPVETLRNAGVSVGIGTDGAASNNRLDMFKEMHLAALLAKHENEDPEHGKATDILYMATLGSADTLGLGDRIGSLEPGKAADFIALDTRQLGIQPLYDPFAALVHGTPAHAVSDVFVNGAQLLRNRELVTIEEAALIEKTQAWHADAFGTSS